MLDEDKPGLDRLHIGKVGMRVKGKHQPLQFVISWLAGLPVHNHKLRSAPVHSQHIRRRSGPDVIGEPVDRLQLLVERHLILGMHLRQLFEFGAKCLVIL